MFTAEISLSEKDWYEMHKQSLEYKFPLINKEKDKIFEDSNLKEEFNNAVFKRQNQKLLKLEEFLILYTISYTCKKTLIICNLLHFVCSFLNNPDKQGNSFLLYYGLDLFLPH